jgi:uncharacterized membrane protein YfcA
MHAYEFVAFIFLISISAGLIGALTGLGGGIVVTPALTLLLGRYPLCHWSQLGLCGRDIIRCGSSLCA